MRKLFIFCVVLAGIAMMVGCQKEQDGVSLKAVISNESKAYIGTNNYPFWESDDEVNINGRVYPLDDINGTYAIIHNVQSEVPFCAIFPVGIVNEMGTPNATSTTARIFLDPHQEYSKIGSVQRLDMPMAALTSGNTLYFKNLCSVIRVNVTNTTSESFDVKRISVTVTGAQIAEYGMATITPNSCTLTMSSSAVENAVTLSHTDGSTMETIAPTNSKPFDIIVPTFSSAEVTFRVETNRGFFDYIIDNAHIDNASIIAPLEMNVNQLSNNEAYLIPGPQFNAAISGFTNYSRLQFAYGWYPGGLPDESHRVKLSTDDSRDIYGYVYNGTLYIATEATSVYANPISSHMFENIDVATFDLGGAAFKTVLVTDMSYMFAGINIETEGSYSNLPDISTFNTSNVTTMAHMFEGCDFYSVEVPNTNTSNVSDMSYMFAGCDNLRSLDVTNLSTLHVTDMSHMFDGCSTLQSLDLSSFNTSLVTGMVAMFKDCAEIQGLDLSHFTTNRITDMTDLFNGCAKMRTLRLDQFVISDGTTETDMCLNLNSSDNGNNHCTITCIQAVENKLSQSVTGINLANVVFARPTSK